MKFITPAFLLSLLFTITATAQGWQDYKPHSVDFIFGIEYGHRLLSTNSENEDIIETVRNRNGSESGKANWRVGFNYNYLLNERFFLKTGLRFVNTGYRSRNLLSLSSLEKAMISESNLESKTYKGYHYNYQMLEFPLSFRFVYSENWCKSYAEFGFSANHYLRTNIDGKDDNLIIKQNLKSWNFSTALAIGAEFLIQKRLPAFIQMAARSQMTSITEGPINEKLMALGVESGIRYTF